jgi:hypothetical protein
MHISCHSSLRSFSCKFNHDIKTQNNTAQNNAKQIKLFKNKIETQVSEDGSTAKP